VGGLIDALSESVESCAGREAGEFEAFERESGEEALGYARALRVLGGSSARSRLASLLSHTGNERIPEALPTDELDREHQLSIEFRNKWRSHEEARRWAVEVLQKSRNVCGRRQPTITWQGSVFTYSRDTNRLVLKIRTARKLIIKSRREPRFCRHGSCETKMAR